MMLTSQAELLARAEKAEIEALNAKRDRNEMRESLVDCRTELILASGAAAMNDDEIIRLRRIEAALRNEELASRAEQGLMGSGHCDAVRAYRAVVLAAAEKGESR